MDAIGIRITFLKNKWPELNKMSEAGQLMMWGLAWTSGVPDGIDFYSYFYSKNIGTSNDARMRLPAFDALYEKSRQLPDGPARTALFDEMNDLIFNYAPWILTDYPYQNVLAQPWLKGYKLNTFVAAAVALSRRRTAVLVCFGGQRARHALREIPAPARRRGQQRLRVIVARMGEHVHHRCRFRRCVPATSRPRGRRPGRRRAGRA